MTEKSHKGAGRFVVRKTESGNVIFYYRYVCENGSRDSYSLGYYDPKGINGMTLIQARDKAGELSRKYRSGIKNLRSDGSQNQMYEIFNKDESNNREETTIDMSQNGNVMLTIAKNNTLPVGRSNSPTSGHFKIPHPDGRMMVQ